MAAAIKIFCDYGGTAGTPGTEQDTSALSPNLRFKTTDDNLITSDNPIKIPAAGSNYSYWKHVYLKCVTTPPTSYVNNVKFYSDGTNSFGTGITMKVAPDSQTASHLPVRKSEVPKFPGYVAATGTSGTTGNQLLVANHTQINSVPVNIFTYTSVAPLSVTISETSNQIDADGETTDYVVLQMEVASNAVSGQTATETFTFKYDEV